MHIPIVAQLLRDPAVRLVPRALDDAWRANEVIPSPGVLGYCPFYGDLFYAARGAVARWLTAPEADARDLNQRDRLLEDVLFLAHDYLHAWAYAVIRSLDVPHSLGYGRIRERDIDDMAFIHLLTETCATVGLDYWYLATVDLNEVCDLGTEMRFLAVTYHERNLPEYRRANPDLTVQTPEYFEQQADFYCTGELFGFSRSALQRSPMLLSWLRRELAYGQKQRVFIRQWLRWLGGFPPTAADLLGHPVDVRARWKRRLIRDVGEMLWDKVKNDVLHPLPPAPVRDRWRRPTKDVDFRYVNLNALSEAEIAAHAKSITDPTQAEFFGAQLASRYVFDEAGPDRVRLTEMAHREKNPHAMYRIFQGARRVAARGEEPRDLFFPI